MSVRSNLDTEQFLPVAVPSAAAQEARRQELAGILEKSICGSGDPYENRLQYLKSTAQERCSSKLSFEQVTGDIPLGVNIVDLDDHSRLNRLHLVHTTTRK